MVRRMNELSTTQAHRSQPEKFAEVFFLAVLFMVALLANSTICSAMLQPYRLKTPANVFPFSLMVANTSLALFHTPFAVVSVIMDRWPFGNTWCQLCGMLINLVSVASNLSVVSIAIHRYYLVVRPLSIKVSIRRARTMVAFVWFCSLVSAVPPLFGWNSYRFSPGKAFCSVNWQDGGPSILYSVYLVAVSFLVPFVILVYVYRAIFLKAKRQRMRTGYNTLQGLNSAYLRKPPRNMPTVCQSMAGCLGRTDSRNSTSSHPTSSEREAHSSPTTSTSAFSFESPSTGNTSLNREDELRRKKQAIKQTLNRQSSIYEQKTVQNAFILLLLFVVNLSPYYIVGLWSGFSQQTPPSLLDFITSWIFVAMAAVNPTLYGFLNRPVRRAVLKSAIGKCVCHLCRCWREDYINIKKGNAGWARRNEGIDSDC